MTEETVSLAELDDRVGTCICSMLTAMDGLSAGPFDVRVCLEFLTLVLGALAEDPPDGLDQQASQLLTAWFLHSNTFISLRDGKVVLLPVTSQNFSQTEPAAFRLWEEARAGVAAVRSEFR